MTTMMLDNPLVDFSRAGFSSFDVPNPIKAAVADSIIKENREQTPQSAINQRRTERLTVSELNDMDMDEIVKRAYMVPIDTRGPVTRFLDLIDLPRNALFNLAAGDTARRKQGMGDTAALGLPRVNTSDVLESLGVRPGLVTGILGFVGDVALDPLTYIGPPGWGVRLTGKAGKAVSMTGKGGDIIKNTVKEVEAGKQISNDILRRYVESSGLTADMIAKGDRKAMAKEVGDILGQGERSTFNKVMRIFGEAEEFKPAPGKNTIADDISDIIRPEADDLTKARVTAAKDFYKEYGRPFTPGIRIVKDPASKIGYSFTTSRNVPKGSGVFHVPFTQYDISVPAFTPAAIQSAWMANIVNDAVVNGEFFSSDGMVKATELREQIKDLLKETREQLKTIDVSTEPRITEVAGTTTPMPTTQAPTIKPLQVGDEVQWTSQGAAMFETPRKVTGISDDGTFAFVEGTSTGLPVEQLTKTSPEVVDQAINLAPMEARIEALGNLRERASQILRELDETIIKMEADPNTRYPDLLYAREQRAIMAQEALLADKQAKNLFGKLDEAKKYKTQIDKDVSDSVTDSLVSMSAKHAEGKAVAAGRRSRVADEEARVAAASVEANVEASKYDPATPIKEGEEIAGTVARGLTKSQVYNSEKMLSGHADPALDLDLRNQDSALSESWWNYRSSDPTTPKGEEALGKLLFVDEPVYDQDKIANLPDLGQLEFVTDEQQRLYDEALKAATIGTRRVELNPGQGLDFLADRDSQALTHLQLSLLEEGKVMTTKIDRIDVNKLQVGDTFRFGKASKTQANPLTIEVIKIDDEGRVYVKAKMPQVQEKRLAWYERAKKTKPVAAIPDRYYILKPGAENIYATRGVDGNPTVLRKVETEAPQRLTNDLNKLNEKPEFVQRVDTIARSTKVEQSITSRYEAGKFERVKDNLAKANGLENKRHAIKDISEEDAGQLLQGLGNTPEDDLSRKAIYEKFQGLRPAEPTPAPVVAPTPSPAAAINYDRMSAAELKTAAKQAGVDTRLGRAEMIRALKEKAAEAAPPVAAKQPWEMTASEFVSQYPGLPKDDLEASWRGHVRRAAQRGEQVPQQNLDTVSNFDSGRAEPKKQEKVIKSGIGGWQIVDPDSVNDSVDSYLYHVTTRANATKILKSGFLKSPRKQAMGEGVYREYSKGKVFFTEADAVGFWRDRISEHLESQGSSADLVVVRVPRDQISGLQADAIGTRDAGGRKAYYAESDIRPSDVPAQKVSPPPAAATPTPKPAAAPTPITVGPEKIRSSQPPMTPEKRADLMRQLNRRTIGHVEAISKMIYAMTREQVPSIDLDQIIDVVSEIVFRQTDPAKITPEYIIRNVKLKLFDEATPGQFRYESFGRDIPTKQRAREIAMSNLRMTEDDLRNPVFGQGTVYEGMSKDEIRKMLAAEKLNESLQTIRFKKHPEVRENFNAEMSDLRLDQMNRFVQVDETNNEIERRIRETTAKITRDGKKAAKDRMKEADAAWRETQRRQFAEARTAADTDAYFEKLKQDIYNKADDDIAAIEQQTKIALQNVEQDVSQTVLRERGLTEADMDTRLGKGTEYEGLNEQQIEAKVLRKHEDAYEQKYAEELAQDKTKAVQKYFSDEEIVDADMEVAHLHAMADAAARISNASDKPLLAVAGNKVNAASGMAREALGLGADDLGSGILASMATMTEPFATQGQYGQAAYEMLRGLERTLTNRMGLAPGIANDVVKNFVRAQDITQTQSFRMAIADIHNTLFKSGIPKDKWDEANSLAMALIFVGKTPIEEMKLRAADDIAFAKVLEAIEGGLLDPKVYPDGAKAIQGLADKYGEAMRRLDEGSGIKNYVPNVLTPQAQQFINFQRNNDALLLSGTPTVGGAGNIGVPAEQTLERFQKPRSTIEHKYKDPVSGETVRFLESEIAYLDYSEAYLQSLVGRTQINGIAGLVSGEDMAGYIRARQAEVKKWFDLTEVQRQTAETYYLSPHEINHRVKNDKLFSNLTNRALNGNDFMYADLVHAVSQRLGGEERKVARDTLQKYLAPYELLVDEIQLRGSGTAGGKKPPDFFTTNGTKVQIVNENGENVIYVGNIKYRRPKAILSSEFSVGSLFNVNNQPITKSFYPEPIADIIDDAAGLFGKPYGGSNAARAFGEQSNAEDNFARVLKATDQITGYWKITTLLHPSWTVNDIVGNLFLMANMGISPEKAVRYAFQTLKFILAVGRGDDKELSKMQIAGKSGLQHISGPIRSVIDTANNVEVSRQMRTTGEFVDPYAYSMIRAMKNLAKGDINGARQEFTGAIQESLEASRDVVADRIATKPGVTTAGAKARVGADFAFNQMLVRRVWQSWAHLNGISNNWLKATAYFSLLDEGYDATQAARLVSEKMLDMSVLTSTDRAARRLFPFYNWMKNSGVLGVREFLRNPKYFTIAPKVKQALEESFNGDENLPENARPSWIRDQLAMQIGTDPDTRRALTLTSSLPTEAATYAISFLASPFLGWGALQDSLAYVTNSLTPVIKVPTELGARKEFFTKRVISSEGGDITPSEYLISQVRPLRELGVGSLRGGPLIRAFQDDPILGISRGLIGGRLQPFDEERRVQNLQREYDERVDSLRRRIGIAERENQKEESIRRRIDLLKLFNQMEGLGLSIPKWAGRQVEQIKAAQETM